MKLAILSDIHGNLEALQQVLADIDTSEVTEIFCLGDIIGYGPEPNQVISLILKRAIPTVLGNHELAVLEPEHLEWFNPNARVSLNKTVTLLTRESHRYIEKLESSMVAWNCRFVHGFPPDSPLTYLTFVPEREISRAFNSMKEKVCFIGHTHKLELIEYTGKFINRSPLKKGILYLNKDNQYIVNIGSVGQPRDGDNTAKYGIWDTERCSLEVRFIPYDIQKVADKIIAAGLPEVHAHRLW